MITPDIDTRVMGLLAQEDDAYLASILFRQLQSSDNHRYRLHYFARHGTELLTSLRSGKGLPSYISAQLEDIALADVSGCHRIVMADGRVTLDIHLGDIFEQLKALAAAKHERHGIHAWLVDSHKALSNLGDKGIWQMARLSHPQSALFSFCPASADLAFRQETMHLTQAGFSLYGIIFTTPNTPSFRLIVEPDTESRIIANAERRALDTHQLANQQYNPLDAGVEGDTAIIGGGVASASLILSLAERGKQLSLFCMDSQPGEQASGNKQGAVYPLLTPEHGPLSHYFIQGYLFSRQRIAQLIEAGHEIAHDFCGVLQTGHDTRSKQRLKKIIAAQPWADKIVRAVNEEQANELAGVAVNQAGIYYPLGGWVCPQALTQATIAQATQLAKVSTHYDTRIEHIEHRNGQWFLSGLQGKDKQIFGPFSNLVLANGRYLTDFMQSNQLPVRGFRGQVSHIPSRKALTSLKTVLCAHGYLTPAHDKLHCTGASYVKDPDNLAYSPSEQLQNLEKIRSSYDANWTQDIDIRGHSARVGVRMVTRDHAPMMGCAPDFDTIELSYQDHQHTQASALYWQQTPAPIHKGLFILGGLGSRGLTSGPLAAEMLAAQICGELMPATLDILTMLNPNRMWLRKLIKGKALL